MHTLLAPPLLAASVAYSMGDSCLDGWTSSSFATPTVCLRNSHATWHKLAVPISKKMMEQIFEILILKFLANF